MQSRDPNEKRGVDGFDDAEFIRDGATIVYRINFENLGAGSDPTPTQPATAPAQRVEITDQLSTNLDWSTLQFTEFGFGDALVSIPGGGQYYFSTLFLTLDGQTFNVDVELSFDAISGVVRAVFQSVDPDTFLPPDVLTGFLPPEDGTGRGKGHIAYTILPKADLPTGTELRNVALISFDGQTIIATNQIDPHDPSLGTDPNKEALNTIDAGGPTSSVAPLPSITNTAAFTLSWSGNDDAGGSGIASYDVYVSDNGGPFTVFLTGTTLAPAEFTGLHGHTYSFYSVATDNVGHRQPTPAAAQASTTLELNQAPTGITLLNPTVILAENTNTGAAIELGEISVTDDEYGTNSLSLSGSDAAYFDIVSGRLVVRPGTVLDYETKSSYSVVIEVDDPTVGNSPDAFLNYVLNLTDVDEVAPTASFSAVSPNVRLTPVGAVKLNFSEAVSGVDISDLTLTRNGQIVSLTGLNLLPGVGGTFTIDLSGVTAQGGEYVLTLNAAGSGIVDAAANALAADASVSWTNVSITGFVVQQGEAQRSFVRYLEVAFGTQTGLDALIAGNRIRLMRYDLNGANGVPVGYGTVSKNGSTLQFDFGPQGIGGNRNSINGDGYYVLEFDLDNNGAFESSRRFYRLLGDVNGSRKVDATDVSLVKAQIGQPYVAAYDVNGDGIVDARDVVIIQRSVNRQLNATLLIDG